MYIHIHIHCHTCVYVYTRTCMYTINVQSYISTCTDIRVEAIICILF